MITDVLYVLLLLVVATNVASAAYVLVAIRRVHAFRRPASLPDPFQPPVTVLKPVCGLDVGLYENLRSFCVQDYGAYQVVFGVRDAADAAIPVIERLLGEFPWLDMTLVVDPSLAGPNLKVSNLDNMYRAVKHDYLIIADSDMRVEADYIATVVASFRDPAVGVVTCLYKGTSAGGLPSLLATMFINEWFLPSVLVSAGIQEIRFCLGATMAVRRVLLERIGGFKRLASYLADDHMLGRLISASGFKVALSSYIVENVVFERSLKTMLQHELRWARTVRTVQPLGHAFSFLMYGIPLAFLAALLIDLTIDWDFFAVGLVALAVLVRMWMHVTVRRRLGRLADAPLLWGASFFSRRIDWKGTTFTVTSDGVLAEAKGPTP